MAYDTLIDPVVRLASGDYARWETDRGGELFLQAIATWKRARLPDELFLMGVFYQPTFLPPSSAHMPDGQLISLSQRYVEQLHQEKLVPLVSLWNWPTDGHTLDCSNMSPRRKPRRSSSTSRNATAKTAWCVSSIRWAKRTRWKTRSRRRCPCRSESSIGSGRSGSLEIEGQREGAGERAAAGHGSAVPAKILHTLCRACVRPHRRSYSFSARQMRSMLNSARSTTSPMMTNEICTWIVRPTRTISKPRPSANARLR